MQKKGKINLDEVIGDFVVKNTSAFKSYLKQLWNDLSKREKSIKNGIDRISFGKYYDFSENCIEIIYTGIHTLMTNFFFKIHF